MVSLITRNGEAKLPGTGPSQKGRSLSDDMGPKTFSKPEDEIRDPKSEDESIFRVDNADDLTKEQTEPDVNEDNADSAPMGYAWPGKQDISPKTKYPYRDDRQHAHNAALTVVERVRVAESHDLVVAWPSLLDKIATKIQTIETGLNPSVEDKAKTCTVVLKRADVKNLRWLFSVDCGNGPKIVKAHAIRPTNVTQMTKMHLKLACSCPAWRWLGPEHHSKREEYLDGKPRGTASVPVIRDPEGVNRVCKHVAAVLSSIRKWQVPKQNQKK